MFSKKPVMRLSNIKERLKSVKNKTDGENWAKGEVLSTNWALPCLTLLLYIYKPSLEKSKCWAAVGSDDFPAKSIPRFDSQWLWINLWKKLQICNLRNDIRRLVKSQIELNIFVHFSYHERLRQFLPFLNQNALIYKNSF